MNALYRLRPRCSSKRWQYNFSAALGADAGTASKNMPSQEVMFHSRHGGNEVPKSDILIKMDGILPTYLATTNNITSYVT